MALVEANQRRKARDLRDYASAMALASHAPKKIEKGIKAPPSRLHGGRQRGVPGKWWGRQDG